MEKPTNYTSRSKKAEIESKTNELNLYQVPKANRFRDFIMDSETLIKEVTMEPFRMGEYWYIKIDGRLIQCESYSAAWDLKSVDADGRKS